MKGYPAPIRAGCAVRRGRDMPFLNYIANRLLQTVPVIFGVSLVGFFAIHLVPGDPIQIMMHGRATQET